MEDEASIAIGLMEESGLLDMQTLLSRWFDDHRDSLGMVEEFKFREILNEFDGAVEYFEDRLEETMTEIKDYIDESFRDRDKLIDEMREKLHDLGESEVTKDDLEHLTEVFESEIAGLRTDLEKDINDTTEGIKDDCSDLTKAVDEESAKIGQISAQVSKDLAEMKSRISDMETRAFAVETW